MIITPRSSFTRPANTDAYHTNDLVANSATAGSVIPLTFSVARMSLGRGSIRRAILFKDDETTTNANFNLHLFTQAPTVTNGDGGAFAVDTCRYFLGTLAFDMTSGAFATTTDLVKGVVANPELNFDLHSISDSERRMFGFLQAAAAYGPASEELFEVTLEITS